MKKLLFLTFVFAMTLLFSGCLGDGIEKVVVFERDIKNEFCGPVMNFKFCKCAFHGEFCEDPEVKMSKKEADEYVQAEFKKWEDQELDVFANDCKNRGGVFTYMRSDEAGKCSYCAEGFYADQEDRRCVKKSQ
jgi:hypothetical protein